MICFLPENFATRFQHSPSKARITDQSNSGSPLDSNCAAPLYPSGNANPPAAVQRLWCGRTQWEHVPIRKNQDTFSPASLRYRCENSLLSTARTSFQSLGSSCAVRWSSTHLIEIGSAVIVISLSKSLVGRRDSNSRSRAPKARAFNQLGHSPTLVARHGIEPYPLAFQTSTLPSSSRA